jgi:hypothetical protein
VSPASWYDGDDRPSLGDSSKPAGTL